jgi:hypothetical protein
VFSGPENGLHQLKRGPCSIHNSCGARSSTPCTNPDFSMPVVFIAVLIAADAARRITIAKLAAALVVAAFRAELRSVKGGKQSSPAYLPRDCR